MSSGKLAGSVHPHTHGELNNQHSHVFRVDGSSPYTRGTPARSSASGTSFRFIPIHTGNSKTDRGRGGRVSVHPHTHGELIEADTSSPAFNGSSPYTRGTLSSCQKQNSFIRFIPIHTGNSGELLQGTRDSAVHPHTHGELEESEPLYLFQCGSSPYTRGTRLHL